MDSVKVASRTLTFQVLCACKGCQKKYNKIKEKISGVDSIYANEDQRIVTFIGTVDPSKVMQELGKITKNFYPLEALPGIQKKERQKPVHEAEAPPQEPQKSRAKSDQFPKHKHRLKRIEDNKRFACNGCKMDGFNARYRCGDCTYELHEACNEPKESISPNFFPELTFHFCNKAPSNSQLCVACGNIIQGRFYCCKEKAGLYLHPSCSKLPARKFIGGTDFRLAIKSSSGCMWCKKKKGVPGWFYVSSCNKYRLHVYCITQLEHEAWKNVEKQRTCGDASTDFNEELMDVKLRDMFESKARRRFENWKEELMDVKSRDALKRKGRGGFKYWKPLCSFLRVIIGVILGDVPGTVSAVVAIVQLILGN